MNSSQLLSYSMFKFALLSILILIPVLVLQIVEERKIRLFKILVCLWVWVVQLFQPPCQVSWMPPTSVKEEELSIPLPIWVISGPIWVVLAHQALKTVDPRVESSVAINNAGVRFCFCPLLGISKKPIWMHIMKVAIQDKSHSWKVFCFIINKTISKTYPQDKPSI